MKPRLPLNPANAGFTLLEVALALTLFAVLGAILYGAFSLGHRAMEKSQIVFDRNQKFRSAVDLLGSYIRSSHPYRASPQDPVIFYAGEETQVEFISAFSLAQGGRGMAKIRIYAENGQGDGQIIKLEEAIPVRIKQETETPPFSNSLVLRERVSGFRLAYLDARDERENWLERWDQDERQGMPRAVRLSYRDEFGKDVQWTFPVMMTVLAP
ncbi:MAG: prepilin-type N-terminal cleavage/methylation domain-containing protein [Deltaproteobacteria bacterium]|nr:prepilin-type N-terminal cleavage/methylation domain-containing protein [Deltaproteobacteria bacterium]